MRKSFTPKELADMDLEAYLASTSGEDSNGSGAEALKRLVGGGGDSDGSDGFFEDSDEEGDTKKPEEGDMEATFSVKATKLSEELAQRAKEEEKKHGKKGGRTHTLEKQEKSTWETYLDKRKEKRREKKAAAKAERQKRREAGDEDLKKKDDEGEDEEWNEEKNKADLELLMMDKEEEDRGFNLRGKLRSGKLRAKKGAGGEFAVDTEDPRIAKVFTNADFEIDPTNPEYRPSKGMSDVLRKKRARKASKAAPPVPEPVAESARPSIRAADDGGGLQLFARKRPTSAANGPSSASQAKQLPATDKTLSKKERRKRQRVFR
eukprot:gnl/TRDRNA2_/TRDRNA2_94169_c0_seq1.p1 gnl/TRDRNA2_/TRDRNA2_94169_c0~~gnl/TRDRNA2_/TRDRNA2_94169_c0_seq1.p1  ORF type:complete len:320 (-),score=105.95 gnl/TRDRNA2_/TRDRNA2_94169_c0_seq1:1-960(-)